MTRPAAAALAALAALGSPPAAASPPPGTPPAAAGYASCLERGPAAGAAAPGPAPAEAAARERDLEEAAGWARRLEEMAREYRQEIQLLVERKYDQRRRALSERYERAIRSLEAQDRQEREDAIAQLLALLSRYPDDPGVAPDAMFRLAELRMEAADDEYARQLADWRERVGTAVAAPGGARRRASGARAAADWPRSRQEAYPGAAPGAAGGGAAVAGRAPSAARAASAAAAGRAIATAPPAARS